MIDAIFDIAHEAFCHQQKQDSDQTDPRNWHEWEQLFIEGAPIVSAETTQEQTEEAMKNEAEDRVSTSASTNIEHLELVDYLNN